MWKARWASSASSSTRYSIQIVEAVEETKSKEADPKDGLRLKDV
jgi:hypothetical protein